MPKEQAPAIFSEATFQFLRDLKDHNDREWFLANRARYDAEVKGPMLAFVMAFAEPLEGINRHFVADPRPVGGSMFRIYRDARFSKDKSPYKTNVGAQFRHQDCTKDVHAPGFYFHLEPGASFVGGGLWHPDPAALHKVREWLIAHPRPWKALRAKGIEVQGEALKRVPAGFAADHPLAEDLKLKDFSTHIPLTDQEICAPGFLEQAAQACRHSAPLVGLLTKALELPW